MAALTTVGIARFWASAFVENRNLKHWAESSYSQYFQIQVGADMRRPPDSSQAPFISVFPDTVHTGPQRMEHSHELGLVVGLEDAGWEEINGVREMRGLNRLDEVCPIIESIMRMALPRARVQEIAIEYEILQFPLVMALFTVTVEESLPIGSR